MNLSELENKIHTAELNVEKEKAAVNNSSNEVEKKASKDSLVKCKKELAKLKNLYRYATTYSDEITDPNTAIILYTTKQANLFLGFSHGVIRRIRKGYYVNKQDWLLTLLRSKSRKDRLKALNILRFDISKFQNVNIMEIKFESIEKELDNCFWSF